MEQTLVIQEKYFNVLSKELTILNENGYDSPDDFIWGIIRRLNDEFSFLEISGYRFFTTKAEGRHYGQYGGYVDGDNLPFERVVIFFTPIDSKLGNVIIEQSLMPTVCRQMEEHLAFLCDNRYKKIVLLTSRVNADNEVSVEYNKLQMDVNSLNTLNFDVIPFLPVKNLSTDTKFNTLDEYIEMSEFLQKKTDSNSQFKYLSLEDFTLYGDCEQSQLKGEFIKSFCFRFLTAIFAGGNKYKYNIDKIFLRLSRPDNQFASLKQFVDYANTSLIAQTNFTALIDDDTVEADDELSDFDDIHRKPERGTDTKGRKRFKTQKRIRDFVLKKADYMCDCNDSKHFYFESVEFHNYVEGHHIVPMNRQEEYLIGDKINLDIPNNIVPLCPNCHSQIHLGSRQARIKIISELYVRNKVKLQSFVPDLSLAVLASYYNIGLESEEEKYWLQSAEVTVENKRRGK